MAERAMTRGDTLTYLLQVLANPVTRAVLSQAQGLPFPPGFAPLDITGGKLWFTLKRTYADPDRAAVAQLSSPGGGIVLTSPASGKATVTVPALVTANFPDGLTRLLYDVQLLDASGNVTTTEGGAYDVSPDVTRTTTAVSPPPPTITLPTGSVYPAGSYAGLLQLDDTAMGDSQLAETATHRAFWVLDKLDNTTPLVANMVQGTGSGKGRWRRTAIVHPFWDSKQLLVDPLNVSGNASDENDGLTATTRLLTAAEFGRRCMAGTTFTYREGGVRGGAVFTSFLSAYWAAYAAQLLTGLAEITIDDSLSPGNAFVAAGAYDFSRIDLVSAEVPQGPFRQTALIQLTLNDGVTVAGTGGSFGWRRVSNLGLVSIGNSAITTIAANTVVIRLEDSALLLATGTAPFFRILGAGRLFIQENTGGNIQNNGVPVVTFGAASTGLLQIDVLSPATFWDSTAYDVEAGVVGTVRINYNAGAIDAPFPPAVDARFAAYAFVFFQLATAMRYQDVAPVLGATDVQAAITAVKNRIVTGVASIAVPALDIDWSLSNAFTKTIAANSIFTFSNSVDGEQISLRLTIAAGNTVTFPAGIQWPTPGNVQPVQANPGSAIWTFIRFGATVYGTVTDGYT